MYIFFAKTIRGIPWGFLHWHLLYVKNVAIGRKIAMGLDSAGYATTESLMGHNNKGEPDSREARTMEVK